MLLKIAEYEGLQPRRITSQASIDMNLVLFLI